MSVGPAGVELTTSRVTAQCSTNWATGAWCRLAKITLTSRNTCTACCACTWNFAAVFAWYCSSFSGSQCHMTFMFVEDKISHLTLCLTSRPEPAILSIFFCLIPDDFTRQWPEPLGVNGSSYQQICKHFIRGFCRIKSYNLGQTSLGKCDAPNCLCKD